ncbi:hypothetical protein [Streptomyces smaragdinus]|uniref:hypothetical protein n=1 Tax=Streptomyces smaragdinus TaxID=2585196 RepID=UPI001E5F648D|nr:hypothetical protein [Streptomyces smaragdinus]
MNYGLNPTDREHVEWLCVPFFGVGPLRFGQSHEATISALGEPVSTRFRCKKVISARFGEILPQVAVYYDNSERLSCIAIDAEVGPQVVLGGLKMVGRKPSELEGEFVKYANSSGVEYVSVSQEGDFGSDEFGIVLRAQRSGDFLASRPVFVSREWSESVCDMQTGFVPEEEWRVR